MYTGIVQGVASVSGLSRDGSVLHLVLDAPDSLCEGAHAGASVAVNGTCLTVTSNAPGKLEFDISAATAGITNLGSLEIGQEVNLERSARQGEENGGHSVYGHVWGTAEVVEPPVEPANRLVIRLPEDMSKYVFAKGFLSVDGMSLTVARLDEDGSAHFNIIPETMRRTIVNSYRPGTRVNIEVEQATVAIVDTITRTMEDLIAKAS